MKGNFLKIGKYEFPITTSTFRLIEDDGYGQSGWEFEIQTEESGSIAQEDSHLFNRAVRFYSEGDPIPIPNQENLLGVEIFLKNPFDDESGDPYFTLYVFEHGDLNELSLKFVERDGDSYRILVMAKIPKGTVTDQIEDLVIDTWIERLPNGTYGE